MLLPTPETVRPTADAAPLTALPAFYAPGIAWRPSRSPSGARDGGAAEVDASCCSVESADVDGSLKSILVVVIGYNFSHPHPNTWDEKLCDSMVNF